MIGVAAALETFRKVLVVDPDAPTRREVRAASEQDGYQVLEADSGAEALRQVEHSHPNLILLEVTLPAGSAFAVCRDLSKMNPPAPAIIMSPPSHHINLWV